MKTELQKIIGLLTISGLNDKDIQDICLRLEKVDTENQRMREALQELSKLCEHSLNFSELCDCSDLYAARARAALEGKSDG